MKDSIKVWLKKNWLFLIFLFMILIFAIDHFKDKSDFRKNIRESDKRIQDLDRDNREKDKIILDSKKIIEKAEKVVEEKEKEIAKRDLKIKKLQKAEAKVPAKVEALPPPQVVINTAKIIGCDEIELRNGEVVFSLACAKKNLIFIDQADLIRQQRDAFSLSLLDCQEALTFQKIVTYNLFRISWAQFMQKINWKSMYNEKEDQFQLAVKEKKKAWRKGLMKGIIIGVIITIALSILRGK